MRNFLGKVIAVDEPVAKRRGGGGTVDAMIEKEGAVDRLLDGYKLPLDEAADAALRFSIADVDVCRQTIYLQHAKGGRAQPLHQIEGVPQHDAEPLLAVAEAAS